MEVGSSHGQPSSVVRPLKHSGGGVTCTHDPVGEEWSEWAIRWPPRESRWEVHVRVPRKPKAAVLQIPTPHLALAGVMAANNGEWRNKFGPFQSATQAFHDCFEKLFPKKQIPTPHLAHRSSSADTKLQKHCKPRATITVIITATSYGHIIHAGLLLRLATPHLSPALVRRAAATWSSERT